MVDGYNTQATIPERDLTPVIGFHIHKIDQYDLQRQYARHNNKSHTFINAHIYLFILSTIP